MKNKGYSKRILAVLCAVAMVLTMFPGGLIFGGDSFAAAEENQEQPVAEQTQEAAEESKPDKEESKPEPAAKTEEESKPEASEPQAAETEAKPEAKEETKPEEKETVKPENKSDSESKAEEKTEKKEEKAEKAEEEKGFKVEFDFGDNYARFNPINPRTTDKDGRFELPEKPKAREKVYEAENGKEYYFTGWKYKDKEYEPGDKVVLKDDAKFKAVWKQTYTIKFSAKGIKADKVESQTEVFDEPVVLPEETASKDGMDFIGWTPDDGKTVYQAGTKIAAKNIQPKSTSASKAMVRLMAENGDNTPPLIQVSFNSKSGASAQFNVSATDASDIEDFKYYVSQEDITDASTISGWTPVSGDTVDVETQDGSAYLYLLATDKLYNEAGAEEKSNHITYAKVKVDLDKLESDPPVVNITTAETEAQKVKKAHTIDFTVTDASTITSIKVYIGDETTPAYSLNGDATSVTVDQDAEGNKLNGEKTIKIEAEDEWGNKDSKSISCKFDNKKPTIPEFEITGTASEEGFYNADNCGIKVTAADENGISSITVKTTVGGTEKILGSIENGLTVFEADTDTVAGILGEIEDNLELVAVVVDEAGNSNEETIQLNYDAAAPKLVSVETEKNAIYKDNTNKINFYLATTKTKYRVQENNLKEMSLTYTYKENNDSTPKTENGIVDIGNKQVTGEWNKEGVFSDIKVTAKDKAGNTIELADDLNLQKEGEASIVGDEAKFEYGKIIYLTSPKAYIYYESGISPITNEQAKMYLYKESSDSDEEEINAYVSGSVRAETVRIEDPFLWLFPERFSWQTSDGVKTLRESLDDDETRIEWDSDKNVLYAKINNINIVENNGDKNVYSISGTGLLGRPLNVIETPVPPEIVEDDNNVWPEAGAAETALIHFVMDTAPPEYKSTFDSVNLENVDGPDDKGVYTAYYGKSFETSGITGTFEFVDANLNTDESVTGANVTSVTDGSTKYSGTEPTWPDTVTSVDPAEGTHRYTVIATSQGVHRFYVYGEDKAGNKLVPANNEETTNYNATIPYNLSPEENDGKYWSMKKVLDTTAPDYGFVISDSEAQDGYYIHYGTQNASSTINLGEEKYLPFRKNNDADVLVKGYDLSPLNIQYSFRTRDKASTSDSWDISGPYTTEGYENDNDLKETKKGETQFRLANLVVKDRAGNESILTESNTVYLDGTKPDSDLIKPTAKIISATKAVTRGDHATGYDLYNSDVVLKFVVKDPNPNKSSSGLKDVWYTASVNGKKISEGKLVEPTKEDGKKSKGFVRDNNKGYMVKDGFEERPESDNADIVNEVASNGDEALTYTITRKLTIPSGLGNGYETNDIVITLDAVDNSGNESIQATQKFGIDTIKPVIKVKYDNNDVRNEKYFNKKRTATVTVTERNLGKNDITIKTQGTVQSEWTHHHNDGSDKGGNSDTWTKTITYSRDGDYTLNIRGTDALGNGPVSAQTVDANQKAPWAFTIDMTAPVLKVTFDNNSVRNRKYYNANRTATVNVVEHNFRASDVKVVGKASGPRKTSLGFPSMGGFSSRGDSRSAHIPFTKEGNFSFAVDYTDLAGNPAKKVVIDEFVIDKTKPVVKIENVINGGIYGGTVAPRAIFDDDNFSRNDSQFRFTGVRLVDRSALVPSFRPNGEYGGSYEMSDFPNIRANDDIYTAYATSTDMAGNTTTVQVVFSVNRFGSTFDYNGDETTINLVSKQNGRFYTNTAENLEIREINVNPIKKYELTLDRGGNSSTMKEGTDYTVVKGSNDQGTTYVYKISKDIVADEGSYNIVVKSEDAAGNINTNAAIRSEEDSEEVPVRFVYDITNPTMSFLHSKNKNEVIELEADKNNRFSGIDLLDLGIVPDDDWALGSIQYVLEGRDGVIADSGVIKGEEFWEVMGETSENKFFTQDVEHGTDVKKLTVNVWDAAGNEETQSFDMLVTSNALEVALHYWYWILAALAAAGGGYGYYRKRKKDSEESEAA